MSVPIGKVFISHSSVDKPFVDRLVTDLAVRNIPVWYDKFDIRVGDSVTGSINEGLASSKYFIIVLSPASVESRWVQEELNAALMQQVAAGGTFLLPVLLHDCNVPSLLKHRRFADFRSDYEQGLLDLTTVWGMDAEVSMTLSNKLLFPWPDISSRNLDFVYLHSTRFDKFFRMECDLSRTAGNTTDYIVETLKLPLVKNEPQLGMRWSFSYRIIFNEKGILITTPLKDAGIVFGSVLRIGINGTYEDVWEKESRSMWDGTKMYQMTTVVASDGNLKDKIRRRGILTSERLREISNAFFSHV